MKIPLFKIYSDKDDIKAVSKVIGSGMNWAIGPNVEKLEKELAKYIGTKYALVFNSGTSALHALMITYGIGPGDEIIVPSFTFIATANASLFVGARPVFADIEEETYGLDPEDVRKKITSKTKVIMPMHYGGVVCGKIKELQKLAKKHKLLLIEDAAESLGARIKNKEVGTFGDAAIFSLCAPKMITTGEGGIVVTSSKKIYEKLKLIRSHGRAETGNYFVSSKHMDYITLGYNFRMSNIIAALGRTQLKKIDKVIRLRRKNAKYLNQKLSIIKDVILPNSFQDYFRIYQMYTIRIKQGRTTRDKLKNYLNQKDIGAKVYFEPVHLTIFYRKAFSYKENSLPITEKISEQVLTLPMYPGLTKEEMDYIIKNIRNFFKK